MLRKYQAVRELAGPSSQRRANLLALALVMVLAGAMAGAALAAERAGGPGASAPVFPATLAQRIESPALVAHAAAGGWKQPAAMTVLQGRWFVLDTGNNRVLEVNEAGAVRGVLDRDGDEGLALRGPMDITSDGRHLYVANSGVSQVVVLEPDGKVVKVLNLERVAAEDAGSPRPIGLAVTSDGELLVTDADNHRLLRYDGEGRLLQAIGAGGRAGGAEGFNTPAGIAVDATGVIYVVDILNGRVVKLSPEGAFLGQLGRLGDTAGAFSRPKDVAVDTDGNVYVSDGLLAAVQVFGPDGRYLGFIGREDPGDADSPSMFRAPAGLAISGGRLYVVDRMAGLFVLDLPGAGQDAGSSRLTMESSIPVRPVGVQNPVRFFKRPPTHTRDAGHPAPGEQ